MDIINKKKLSKVEKMRMQRFKRNLSTESGLTIKVSDGLQQKGDVVYPEEGVAEIVYTAVSEGEQTITASYLGSEEKTTTVLVRPIPAKLESVDPETVDIIVDEGATITLRFDKALVDGQAYPTVTTTDEVEYTTPFTINMEQNGGSIGITAKQVGTGKVNMLLGGVMKTTTVNVLEMPAKLLRVTPNPDTVEVDQDVQFIAEHDKVPELKYVEFTVGDGLVIKEEAKVEGNNVVITYTAKKEGDQRVDVTSYKTSMSGTVTVNPKPIVWPVFMNMELNPNTNLLVGANTEMTLTFDKKDHLELSDIEVTLPEGVSEVTPLAISSDNTTVKGTYTFETEGTKNFIVTYRGETTKNVEVEVKTPAVIDTMTPTPATIKVGGESSIMIAFDKNKEAGQEDPVISVETGLEVSQAYTGNEVGGLVVVRATSKPDSGTAKVTAVFGGQTSEISVNIEEADPKLQSVKITPDKARTNSDITFEATFDKDADVSLVKITPDTSFVEKQSPKADANKITAMYTTGTETGTKKINIVAGATNIDGEVEVLGDAKVSTIEATNDELEYKMTSEITITLDKPFVEGQDEIVINKSEGLDIVDEFQWDPGKASGKLTVEANVPGAQWVSAKLGGETKNVSLTVLEFKVITSVSASEETIENGSNTTVTVNFNRALDDAREVQVQLSAGLTGGPNITLNEDKRSGTIELTGTQVGAQTATFTLNQGYPDGPSVKTQNITVQEVRAKATNVEFTDLPADGAQKGDKITAKITFDKALPSDQATPTVSSTAGLTKEADVVLDESRTFAHQVFVVGEELTEQTVTWAGITGSTLEVKVTPVAKAQLQSVASDKDANTVKLTEEIILTWQFDKEPRLADISENDPTLNNDNITAKEEGVIEGTTVKTRFLGSKVGNTDVTMTVGEVTKTINVIVIDNANLTSVEVSPESIDINNEEATVTFKFDKVPHLESLVIEEDSTNLTISVPAAVSSNDIVLKVKGTNSGIWNVKGTHNKVEKTAQVTVRDGATLQTVTADPKTVNIGQDVTFTGTFSSAPNLALVKITADETKLTVKEPAQVSGNTVVAKYTTKGEAGAAKVTMVHNNVSKEDTCTTQVAPTISITSATAEPNSIQQGAETTVTIAFANGTPEASKITLTPNEFLTESQAAQVSGSNITAKFTGASVGSGVITVNYEGIAEQKTVEVTVTGGAAAFRSRSGSNSRR